MYAEYPGEIDDCRSFADFVHVEDGIQEALAGAFDVRESMCGAGGFEAVLDLLGRTNLLAGGIDKGFPGLSIS